MVDPNIKSIPALQPRLKARLVVKDWVDKHIDKTDAIDGIDADKDIYVVWFCKTLQNWKALLSTTRPDGMYYEVTYNGDKDEIYLDAYKKFDNVTYTSEKVPHKLDVDCWCHPKIVNVPAGTKPSKITGRVSGFGSSKTADPGSYIQTNKEDRFGREPRG